MNTYDIHIAQRYKLIHSHKKLVIAAIIVISFFLCSFVLHKLMRFNPWIYPPTNSPTTTVQSAIEHQADRDYTFDIQVNHICIDEYETKRMIEIYTNSPLANQRSWSAEYLANHFVVVKAEYYVEYDHTKTFLDDGYITQYFYLTQDESTNMWQIVDATTPKTDK